MIKKVYIASPYTIGDQAKNVKRSMECANMLIDNGFVPFIPLLSHFQHMVYPRSYDEWINYDLSWIESCDAVIRLKGESKGADLEVEHAKKLGIPVFISIGEINVYNKNNEN